MKKSVFKLRSGNKPLFKFMGSSPVNQGTELPAEAGGENIESTFGGSIGSGPTSGPVEPTEDEQSVTASIADRKMTAAGGRKWQPGGSPTTQSSPAKLQDEGKWNMYNPDNMPKPMPGDPGSPTIGTGGTTDPGGTGTGSAIPQKDSPTKLGGIFKTWLKNYGKKQAKKIVKKKAKTPKNIVTPPPVLHPQTGKIVNPTTKLHHQRIMAEKLKRTAKYFGLDK